MNIEQLRKIRVELQTEKMIEPNPCWEGYEPYGTKIVDGREVPNCVPTKEGMLPDPFDGNPIDELEFVHEKELLVTLLTKFTGDVLVLAQTNWF
jgi:hypothetical protein